MTFAFFLNLYDKVHQMYMIKIMSVWITNFYFSQQPVHPTTGILAVFVALNYCDVVHIAGFGYPNSKSQRQPIHYYGYDTMKSMKVRSIISCGGDVTSFFTCMMEKYG